MKSVITIAALTLISVGSSAQAAPFEEFYGTYAVKSCKQSAEYTLANFCENAKTVQLTLRKGATEMIVLQGNNVGQFTGAVAILFQDGTTNASASYSSQNGTDSLVDPAVFPDSSLIKTVTVSDLSEGNVSLVYSETAIGWPDPRQNVPYTVEMALVKQK